MSGPRPALTINKLETFIKRVIAEKIGSTRDIMQITRDVARS